MQLDWKQGKCSPNFLTRKGQSTGRMIAFSECLVNQSVYLLPSSYLLYSIEKHRAALDSAVDLERWTNVVEVILHRTKVVFNWVLVQIMPKISLIQNNNNCSIIERFH